MGVRVKKPYPALKHGAYSATGLLPGEDRAAFEKLHLDLRAELRPDGPLEECTVFDIACLLWRKQNLGTFRRAGAARKRYSAIKSERIPSTRPPYCDFGFDYMRNDWTPPTDAEVEAATEAAEARAREELGEDYEFIEMGALATRNQLLEDLELDERLDARMEKLFKRLAMLKAFKALHSIKPPSSTELPRISGPKKAA